MSHLVVGMSHHTASLELLERVLLDRDQAEKLLVDLVGSGQVSEAAVLATCNRLEVFVEVDRFHAGVDVVSDRLSMHTGVPIDELRQRLHVHYEASAVRHVFGVAAGLDSMVVGETQVLGQVRAALRHAQEAGTAGRSLHELLRQAIHVGKRVHAETDLSRTSRSLVDRALTAAGAALGGLSGRQALVIGAGTMSSLAAHALARAGIDRLVIANRTPERSLRLAAAVGGQAIGLEALSSELVAADVVVCCTAATGHVLSAATLATTVAARPDRRLAVVDLALPRDVEPSAGDLDGVDLFSLEHLRHGTQPVAGHELEAVHAAREIVAAEVATFLGVLRAARVAPTVVALRSMAADVVAAELARLSGRLPQLAPAELDEVGRMVRRVVDKLLHAPTVRVKELAADDSAPDYERALRDLFALDRRVIEAVTSYDPVENGPPPSVGQMNQAPPVGDADRDGPHPEALP